MQVLRFGISFLFLTFHTAWGFESFDQVKQRFRSSEGVLRDRHGELLQETRIELKYRQLQWVSLDEISPAFLKAVLVSEDQKFLNHAGVDWRALVVAGAQNLFSKNSRGASTISMQLASILDVHLAPKKLRRNLNLKWRQIQGALALEKTWTKNQILEAYLNLIFFRGELKGIAAAAYGLYQKSPDGLDLSEAVALASLIRSPQASESQLKKRACDLGRRLDSAYVCSDFKLPRLEKIPPRVNWAPHLGRLLIKSSDLQVSLDLKVQKAAVEAVRHQILAVRDRNVRDAAVLVVDNASGEVLAYVGSSGELSSAQEVDGVRAWRQAGSTLKPFLYGMAFEKKYLTPASKMDDTPLDISIGGLVYHPKNYDQQFHGKNISARIALASSLNVPAVQVLSLVGVEPFLKRLEALGFERLQYADYYGPSLALGSVDISLWSLVNAYRTLATQGLWSELVLDLKSNRPVKRVLSEEATFLIQDILSDRESRSLTFGLENALSFRSWAGVKTGTSKDMRDNWCVGFSDRYTVGVWVGNFTGEPMWNVTGVMGAAPIWLDLMRHLHQESFSSGNSGNSVSQKPVPPRGVVQIGSEWFIRGTEPSNLLTESSQQIFAKIRYPVDGMTIAYDPDIPENAQKVFFEANVKQAQVQWVLNGVKVQPEWSPGSTGAKFRGRQHLVLESLEGKPLDTVDFWVR